MFKVYSSSYVQCITFNNDVIFTFASSFSKFFVIAFTLKATHSTNLAVIHKMQQFKNNGET